ncbi:MAG TPA: winged helix-turn-helix domain-containing protein [Rhizomicrobium sp.]|jgi:predicted ATPase/DNA-binding winged helix-turn-helix (wHTH) protein
MKPIPDIDVERGGVISFGPFRVNRASRLIERNGEAVQLGSRAFDILTCLLENAGQVVEKAELLRRVWPNNIVEEGSLRFQINALRKALGEGRYIANIAGQGYSFVAPISLFSDMPPAGAAPRSARPLPPRPRRLIGRGQILETLSDQLLEHRFVTVVGPGGVGKTSVALALAHDLAPRFGSDTCFFDVGSLVKSELLASGLAFALGIPKHLAGTASGITTFLQQRRMLLVLDGCELDVDAAAELAEQIFRETPNIHLLVTSREVLRADGEHVHRLPPLDYPGPGTGQTVKEALAFAAVQLFVERAASSLDGFVLTDDEAPLVSAICRKLDGLALAIELAAGRIGAYGVPEVARQLESQFALNWPARRTAIARHQTLSATLGWSYQLLSAREQLVFRRLSVFAGVFTLEMAAAVVADDDVSHGEATELLGSLVSKSLVQFKSEALISSYRLLDMTRSYAFDKLGEIGEAREMAARHANLVLRLLEGTKRLNENGKMRADELLDDVGAAIEWSLSQNGDLAIGAALAAASAPIWLKAGLMVECRFWMTRVLATIGEPVLSAHRRLAIQAAVASAETFTEGFTKDSFSSWLSALEIAESLGNIEQQLTSLIVLWAHKIRVPQYDDAHVFARRVDELATMSSDRGTRGIADWMLGMTGHHMGQLAVARSYFDRSLAGDTLEARQAMMTRFGYDRRIPTLGALSNLHWLEGRSDQALHLGAVAISEARHSPYPIHLCGALTWQALTLYFRGDDPQQVETLLDEAIELARHHFSESYMGLGLALKGLNVFRTNQAGSTLVAEGLSLLTKANFEAFNPLFLSDFARLRAEGGAGLHDGEVNALLQMETGRLEDWTSAEVKRNLGEILLLKYDESRAAQLFADAAGCAERQGALAWGLRTALSRARAATGTDSQRQSRQHLESLLLRFTEGRETVDVQAASLFLENNYN